MVNLDGTETVLVAVSKGMRAVKLCSNKMRQLLTGMLTNAGCPV